MRHHYYEEWDENPFPLAYLITLRTYATWLHGDLRGWVDTHHRRNVYGSPRGTQNTPLSENMKRRALQDPVRLDSQCRVFVESAVSEVCRHRGYLLRAVNVRSNHLHTVVTGAVPPEKIANTIKAYSTRRLRAEGRFFTDDRVWSRGCSRKYLWKPHQVEAATDYVLYSQGLLPFEDGEWNPKRK